MTAFQLDTSGCVLLEHVTGDMVRRGYELPRGAFWSDLTPFTQGYVEALLGSRVAVTSPINGKPHILAFSDLAPATLARIIEDCEGHPGNDAHVCTATRQHDNGSRFWRMRQGGRAEGFPPLTVSLGDDGKVYLREPGQ